MIGIKGQISLDEYLESKKKTFLTCDDCACRKCLYWWSSRCPYGKCYDYHRAKENPYYKSHPPGTDWFDQETDQAHWCAGVMRYLVSYCERFVKYTGQQVRQCIKMNVSVFQDGYILCSLVESWGCQRCYEEFEAKEDT